MLWRASVINGYALAARDGGLGSVSDLLFDDADWRVRWMVVDVGKWFSGRKVLLPPSVLGLIDPGNHEFSVKVTMQQVEDSPDIDDARPVSRQLEANIYNHYGWSPYWGGGLATITDGYGVLGVAASMGLSSTEDSRGDGDIDDIRRGADDPHLRSAHAVTGYHIHAADGEIGHIADFLIEDSDWSIRYLVVDTRNWWPGKKVLISPRSVREIKWANWLVNLDVDRQRVKDSPAYDASTIVDRSYDEHFDNHYGYGEIQPMDRARAARSAANSG